LDKHNTASAPEKVQEGLSSQLRSPWAKALLYFSPKLETKDYLDRLRDRTFIAFLLTTLFIGLTLFPAAMLLLGSDSAAGIQTIVGGMSWLVLQSLLLWLFKLGLSRTIAVNSSLSLCLVTIAFTTWTSSGIHAVEAPLVLLLPLVALSTLGARSGIHWLIAICIFVFSLGVAPSFGFEAVALPDPKIKAINAGIFLVATVSLSFSIISIAYSANNSLHRRLIKVAEKQTYKARHDGLTSLLNRNAFMKVVSASIERAHLAESNFALVLIDLTGFKQINDTLGHLAGDQLLVGFAELLRQTLRPTDTPARLGGDEFAILFEGVQGKRSIEVALEKLHTALSEPIITDKGPVSLGAAKGIAIYPSDASTVNTLYEASDKAMYHSKRENMPYCFWGDID